LKYDGRLQRETAPANLLDITHLNLIGRGMGRNADLNPNQEISGRTGTRRTATSGSQKTTGNWVENHFRYVGTVKKPTGSAWQDNFLVL